jgi:hypothetical protein
LPEKPAAERQAAEFIVTFDADGQHRVSDISRLVEARSRRAP